MAVPTLSHRNLLMKANQDCYEVEMSRTSKGAIVAAWEKKHATDEPAESIERLRADIAQLVSEIKVIEKPVSY